MKTVREVSRLSGVSVRTLHHYDAIGLLKPAAVTEAGYRLYDDGSLSRLQRILLLRELQFPLKDIRAMLDAPEEDRTLALAQQLRLLEMQRAHIDGLIALTHDILKKGANAMDFSVFDRTAIDDYAAEVRSRWGETAAYRQSQSHSAEENHVSSAGLMAIFGKFGTLRSKDPSAPEAQASNPNFSATRREVAPERVATRTGRARERSFGR